MFVTVIRRVQWGKRLNAISRWRNPQSDRFREGVVTEDFVFKLCGDWLLVYLLGILVKMNLFALGPLGEYRWHSICRLVSRALLISERMTSVICCRGDILVCVVRASYHLTRF